MSKRITIGIPTAWFISLANFAFLLLQIANFGFDWGIKLGQFMPAYYSLLAVNTLILINDIYYRSVLQKWFWISSMLFMAPISPIFYLIQRNKLIKLGEKLKK